MAIEPISIPTAAGVNYGENDVRHFSEGDAVDVPGLSSPTRHLAERDTEIAKKLNDVIGVVNNREQFVPLAIPRTVLPQNSDEIITNYRIPVGFEARILNATVTSVPTSTGIQLSVLYSTGFGSATGTEIVSTATEYTGGAKFYTGGEFIVVMKNTGSTSVDAIGSLLLTMRPVGDTSTLLLASEVVGQRGEQGIQGEQGGTGGTGPVGPVGSPGMVWTSAYSASVAYVYPQVVRFSANGSTDFSAYIALVPTVAGESPLTAPSKWDLVVMAGSTGTNLPGPAGVNGFNFRGDWEQYASPPYAKNDVVRYTSGTIASTYYAGLNDILPDAALNPPGDGWTNLFNDTIPAFSATTVSGTVVTLAGYQVGTPSASFGTIPTGTNSVQMTEFKVAGPGSPMGMAFLRLQRQINFKGNLKINLPQVSFGASANWNASDCVLNAYNSAVSYSSGTLTLTERTGTIIPSVNSTVPAGNTISNSSVAGTISAVSFASSGSEFSIYAPDWSSVTVNILGLKLI